MMIYEFILTVCLLEVSFVVYSSGMYSLFLSGTFLLLFQYARLLPNIVKWEMKEIDFRSL